MVYEEEEDEPFQIDGDQTTTDETAERCLLGKLWTARPYNKYGLIETMKKIWCPTKGMICSELGDNLISFQFNCKRDMARVLNMEPWQFNKHILVLSTISGDIQPSLQKFDTSPIWIRLYDIPMRGRVEATLRQIGMRFGDVKEIDHATITRMARSVRMKIVIDLTKLLKRGTKIRIGNAEPCWVPVTYERLPSFCYWCGKLGHTTKDCEEYQDNTEGTAPVSEDKLPYGEWMKASPLKNVQIVKKRGDDEIGGMRRSLFQRQMNNHE